MLTWPLILSFCVYFCSVLFKFRSIRSIRDNQIKSDEFRLIGTEARCPLGTVRAVLGSERSSRTVSIVGAEEKGSTVSVVGRTVSTVGKHSKHSGEEQWAV
jgi:hypothetical protein